MLSVALSKRPVQGLPVGMLRGFLQANGELVEVEDS
jgi:hypothetical protein